jgi:CRP-like cAMP-binding protein
MRAYSGRVQPLIQARRKEGSLMKTSDIPVPPGVSGEHFALVLLFVTISPEKAGSRDAPEYLGVSPETYVRILEHLRAHPVGW